MAFTDTQKAQIRQYLGYSGLWPNVDTVLEQAMEAIGQDANAVTIALTYITGCQNAEAQLATLLSFNFVEQGSGSAKINPIAGAALTRQQGRMYCGNLAALMGVSTRHDYFSPTLANDAPSFGLSSLVGYNGGGGMMRMG